MSKVSSKIFYPFLGLFLTCFTLVFTEEPSVEQKVAKIHAVEVRGTEEVEVPNVLLKLKTKEKETFNSWIFDEDLKALAKSYDRVEPQVKKEQNQVFIFLKLWPKLTIKKIEITGHTQYKTTTLKHELGLSENTPLQRDILTQALNKVRQHYIKHGYFQAKVTYSVVPITSGSNQIRLIIHIEEGRSCKIDHVEFVGFSKNEKEEIYSKILTQSYNPLLSWLTGKGSYSEESLEEDHLAILNFLHDKGYADAKVDIQVIDNASKTKVLVKIIAKKGKLYTVGKVSVDGNKLLTKSEIEAIFLIHPKDIFSPEKIRQTSQSIKDLYGKKGYIEAEVNFDTLLNEHEPKYDIIFHVEEGEAFKIGMIRIFGNTQTNANVILRESLLIPGEKFDTRKLKATQMRLQNIGYFKNVNVYAVRSRDDFSLGPNYRDIHIEVEEQPTAKASASIGMSSMDDVFGILSLQENNFNIAGFKDLGKMGISALRGGGEYALLKGTFGKREMSGLVSWMTPYLHDSLWRFGTELSITRSKLQSREYRVSTYGGKVFLSYPLNNYWTYGTHYRLRHGAMNVDKDAGEDAQNAEKNEGLVSALSTTLSYDSTDSARKAHRGIRSYLGIEFAGIGGVAKFLKFSSLNSAYVPIWSKGTLRAKAEIQFIDPVLGMRYKTTPMSERLFLGGATTVRGYKNYIIGPRFAKKSEPQGGISSTLLSLEYSQYIFSMMDALAFIDAGAVSKHKFTIRHFNGSYGVGLRFDILHRLPFEGGYCWSIHRDYPSDFKHFYFSFSGIF